MSTEKKVKARKIILGTFTSICTAIVYGAIYGFFVKILWNDIMPDLFNLKGISYVQSFELIILVRLVFGTLIYNNPSSKDEKKSKHSKIYEYIVNNEEE